MPGGAASVPAARPLVAAWLFRVLWLLGIALEEAALDPGTKIAWFKFQALWQLPAATAGLLFVLEYAYPGRWLTRRNLILLSIPVLLDILLIVTGGPQVGWRQLTVGPDGRVVGVMSTGGAGHNGLWGWPAPGQPRGPALAVRPLPAASLARCDHPASQIASRALYVVDAAHLPLPALLDPIVLAPSSGAAGYAIALFGFRILDPLPAARQTAIEQMQAGMVVFDAEWQVVSLNPAAERITGIRAARGPRQDVAAIGGPGCAPAQPPEDGIAAGRG